MATVDPSFDLVLDCKRLQSTPQRVTTSQFSKNHEGSGYDLLRIRRCDDDEVLGHTHQRKHVRMGRLACVLLCALLAVSAADFDAPIIDIDLDLPPEQVCFPVAVEQRLETRA
jgi:hypothetical protein